jgi:hypothetical protein
MAMPSIRKETQEGQQLETTVIYQALVLEDWARAMVEERLRECPQGNKSHCAQQLHRSWL